MLNILEPIAKIIIERTVQTIKFIPIPNWLIPVSAPLSPSTPYVRGLKYEIIFSAWGAVLSGKSAPDKKKRGMIKKFIIRGKACMSLSFDANAVPRDVKRIPIKIMKTSATGIITKSGRNPIAIVIIKTIIP